MSLIDPIRFDPSCDDDYEREPCPCPPHHEPPRNELRDRLLIEAAIVAVGVLLPKIVKRIEQWWEDSRVVIRVQPEEHEEHQPRPPRRKPKGE